MPSRRHFRPVRTPAEITLVASLATIIWQEYYPSIIGAAQVTYMLTHLQSPAAISQQITKDGNHYFLLENHAGEPIGYLALQHRTEGLFISKLYILKPERGKGHAHAAIEFAVERAAEWQTTKLTLTVNRNNTLAISVYQQLGFEITGTHRQDIGGGFTMDDYVMEKSLQA